VAWLSVVGLVVLSVGAAVLSVASPSPALAKGDGGYLAAGPSALVWIQLRDTGGGLITGTARWALGPGLTNDRKIHQGDAAMHGTLVGSALRITGRWLGSPESATVDFVLTKRNMTQHANGVTSTYELAAHGAYESALAKRLPGWRAQLPYFQCVRRLPPRSSVAPCRSLFPEQAGVAPLRANGLPQP